MLCRKDNTSRAEKFFHHNIKWKTGDVMMCVIHKFVKTDKCCVERSLEIHTQTGPEDGELRWFGFLLGPFSRFPGKTSYCFSMGTFIFKYKNHT